MFMVDSSLNQLSRKQNIVKWVFFGLAIAFSLFLIINGAIHGEASAAESDSISKAEADIINTVSPGTITPESFPTFAFFNRKLLGHFLAFTLDSVFATIAIYYFLIPRKWYKFYFIYLISFGFGFIVAAISEIMQLFTPGRTGAFSDVLIDMGGYLLGLVIIFLILFFAKKHHPFDKKVAMN